MDGYVQLIFCTDFLVVTYWFYDHLQQDDEDCDVSDGEWKEI